MEQAIEIIKAHEGLRLRAYRCPAGVWTIGWGHTSGVTEGMQISYDEAVELLRRDVATVWNRLQAMAAEAGISLNAYRMRALTSFIFNVGIGNFSRSTLWKRVRANPDDSRIRNEFMRWNKGGGKVLPGLVSRRMQESALYFVQ